MLQLKNLIPQFLRCIVGDGQYASFWYDYWTELGPLSTMFGSSGTRQLQIPISASVSEAVVNGNWFFPSARSEEAVMLQVVLSTTSVPSPSNCSDTYRLRGQSGGFTSELFISSPPAHLQAAVLMSSQFQDPYSSQVKVIFKLILQVKIYGLWRERNARIFRNVSLPPPAFFKLVDRSLRDRLLSFPRDPSQAHSLLELYFWFVDPFS
ncbi:hypothetical protein Bca52824_087790 [Brassica carinata]|uniref:Uncharacterized protein n=1 Tax=Brassica carinata TaxID=52824 RepID=A0A8X7TN99_BRACI|nr:hypothetical protein Bca52824_087790 [Brassica carinata]